MFDPEKVKRSTVSEYKTIPSRVREQSVVLATDYDRLLSQFRIRGLFIAEVRENCFDDSEWAARIDSGEV